MELRILISLMLVAFCNVLYAMDGIKASTSFYCRQAMADSESLGRELVESSRDGTAKSPEGLFVIRNYLKKGPDLTECDDKGSALMWVCRFSLFEIAKLMIDYGAPLEVASELGYTPLHAAVDVGNKDLVIFLLNMGAKVNACTSDGATALHRAAMKGNVRLVGLLLKRGASINRQTEDGYSPLHYAVQEEHEEVVSKLLVGMASTELTDCLKRTPLHLAAWLGKDCIITMLLNRGAYIDAQECELTPLDVAEHMGHGQIVLDLIFRGASRCVVKKQAVEETMVLPLEEIDVQEGSRQISP